MNEEIRRHRINQLKNEYRLYLDKFTRSCPFSAFQLDCHKSTIEQRRVLGSAKKAINDEFFLEGLRATLKAWGVGIRGAALVGFDRFRESLSRYNKIITELDGLTIEDENLDLDWVIQRLWEVIAGLDVVINLKGEKVLAPIVSGTKTLLHVLPDLVPPVDREYTQAFFGWHNPEFQYHQESRFRYIYKSLAEVARFNKPSRYVGDGWNTCTAKLVDSALVGFCLAFGIKKTP